jgi:lactoylglutathione lyase
MDGSAPEVSNRRGFTLSKELTMHLYETHIPVANTRASELFYREVVGLPFAYRDPTRDIVFMWVDQKEKAMLGLWGPGTAYGPQQGVPRICHFAFAVSYEQLLAAIKNLKEHEIQTHGFGGGLTHEPSVVGWMPSAQIYFRDPDGHSLEYITLLPDAPDSSFIGPFREWTSRLRK